MMKPFLVSLLSSLLTFIHVRSVEPFRPLVSFPAFHHCHCKCSKDSHIARAPIIPEATTVHRASSVRCQQRGSPRPWMQVPRGGAHATNTNTNTNSPKLTQWLGPAICSALSYAAYNIFIKLGSSSINPMLGGVILQFVAALLGTCLLGISKDKLSYDRKGILYSALAGVAVGAAELLSFYVSASGVQASKSTPIMIGGSVVFGSVLGFALLKERMTIKGWFGVFLVVVGIACVATDPGATSMSAH